MGLMKTCFSFVIGAGFGMYAAQNYNVPNIKNLVDFVVVTAKVYEQVYRMPKKGDDEIFFTCQKGKLQKLVTKDFVYVMWSLALYTISSQYWQWLRMF